MPQVLNCLLESLLFGIFWLKFFLQFFQKVEGLGYKFPKLKLVITLVYMVGKLNLFIFIFGPLSY